MPMKSPPTTTHQQKQVHVVKGKPIFYEPADLKAARSSLIAHLAHNVPETMITSSVRLTTKWLFPITAKHKDGEYKYTKPDTDNLQKLLKDCMTECNFWKDDALVVSELIEKFWAKQTGIYIKIEVL
jgi:Holliday junction resolvase RusA-like endonuclease